MTQLSGKRILIVDDEEDLRELMRLGLEDEGASVIEAGGVDEAWTLVQANPVDIVVSDMRMPGGNGDVLLERLQSGVIQPLPVVVVTGFSDVDSDRLKKLGARKILSKPFDLGRLVEAVRESTA